MSSRPGVRLKLMAALVVAGAAGAAIALVAVKGGAGSPSAVASGPAAKPFAASNPGGGSQVPDEAARRRLSDLRQAIAEAVTRVKSADDLPAFLAAQEQQARARVLGSHTAAHRAAELESYLLEIVGP